MSMRKILSLVLVLAMFMTVCVTFSAVTEGTCQSSDELEIAALAFIEGLKYSDESIPDDVKIGRILPLFDENDNVTGECFFLEPEGYVIVQNSLLISEAAFTDTKSVRVLKEYSNQKIYYGGPLVYLVEDEFSNYKEILSEAQFEEHAAIELMQVASDISSNAESSFLSENVTPNVLPTLYQTTGTPRASWNYNPDGRCGATAAAILLAYYADYKDSAMVAAVYFQDGNGETLTKLLTPWIHGAPVAPAFPEDVAWGLNNYFGRTGLSTKYSAKEGSGATKNSVILDYVVNGDTPVILLLNSEPTYGNHYVVAYGATLRPTIEVQSLGNTNALTGIVAQVYVNDGWGNNGVYISIRYCVATVAID